MYKPLSLTGQKPWGKSLYTPKALHKEGTRMDPPTFLSGGEGPSERPSHAYLSVLQVLQSQIANGDGLSIHLEAAPLVACHRSGQNQQLREEEHVQPLPGETLREAEIYFDTRQPAPWLQRYRILTEPLLFRSSP